MRRFLVLPLLLALIGCAQDGVVKRDGASPRQASLAVLGNLPAQLAGAERQTPPQRDPAPSTLEGAWMRYGTPFSRISIYLFREAGAAVPEGADSAPVRQHLANASADISTLGLLAAAQQRSAVRVSYQDQGEFGIAPPGGLAWRCKELRRVAGEPPAAEQAGEFVCVTGVLDRFLKLRATVRLGPDDGPRARGFIAGVAAALGQAVAAQRGG